MGKVNKKTRTRYLEARPRTDGTVGYAYNPPRDAKDAGLLKFEALGDDFSYAREQAEKYNRLLEEWRASQTREVKSARIQPDTVSKLIADYFQSDYYKAQEHSTPDDYRAKLRRFENFVFQGKRLGDMKVRAITKKFVDALYSYWVDSHGRGGANAVFRVARLVFGIAVRWEEIPTNPFAEMNMKRGPKRRVTWDPETQLQAYINAADALGGNHAVTGRILMLCYELSQRHVDMRFLKWDSVDLQAGTIGFTQTKRGKDVWQPLSADVLEVLRKSYDARTSATWVNPSHVSGQPMGQSYFNKLVREVKENAGLPDDLKPFDLRRTAITELLRAGSTTQEVMSLSGHQTEASVQPYADAVGDRIMAANATVKRRLYRLKAEEA